MRTNSAILIGLVVGMVIGFGAHFQITAIRQDASREVALAQREAAKAERLAAEAEHRAEAVLQPFRQKSDRTPAFRSYSIDGRQVVTGYTDGTVDWSYLDTGEPVK